MNNAIHKIANSVNAHFVFAAAARHGLHRRNQRRFARRRVGGGHGDADSDDECQQHGVGGQRRSSPAGC